MSLVSTRGSLDNHLGSVNTLLILFGDDQVTRDVHDLARQMKANGALDATHIPLRLADLSLLTPNEVNDWSAALARHVVLEPNAAAVRIAILAGPIADLLTQKGKPSSLRIKRAFRGVGPS